MLARIIAILGPIPEELLSTGKDVPKYFTSNGILYKKINADEGQDDLELEDMRCTAETEEELMKGEINNEEEEYEKESEIILQEDNESGNFQKFSEGKGKKDKSYGNKRTSNNNYRQNIIKKDTGKKASRKVKESDALYVLMYPKPTSLKQRLHVEDEYFIDFLRSLLILDPAKRPSAAQALRHPFLYQDYKDTEEPTSFTLPHDLGS